MRKQNKTEGHELKVGESVSNSQVDPKETKNLNDFDGIDLPMDMFTK